MEVHPGVFVTNVATEEWEPDPEVGGEMHILVEDTTAYAGMSRFRDVSVVGPWTAPQRETVLVLEGSARVEIEGGPVIDLRTGDLASFPEGAVMIWHLTVPFREVWFFGRPYEAAAE
ncbi:MAG TPA: cupin domain-containing protein [Candidatus Limnocylindria bacterium]|nr:cupin domain-containing protein [Candidatus Limnocylindria bacterium]